MDTFSLSELMFKLDKYVKELSFNMTDYLTISGMAWAYALKTCPHLTKCRLTASPTMNAFVRASCYGGRVLVWKQIFNHEVENDQLICLDGNSLYPSVMYMGYYPIGKMLKINGGQDEFESLMRSGKLLIAEIEAVLPNKRCTKIPYKDANGMLIYPCGKIRGVYNSIDIYEMQHEGATDIKFIKGFYWEKKARIFRKMSKYLYDKRDTLKKENNPYNNVIKILSNSIYGKFLEKLNSSIHIASLSENDKLSKRDYPSKFDEIINNHIITAEPVIDRLDNGQFRLKVKK